MKDEAKVLLIIPLWPTALLVSTDAEIAGVRNTWNSQAKFHPTAASLTQAPSTIQETANPRCATIRQALKARGFQGDGEIMCASWRKTTHKQYEIYLQKWTWFCGGKIINPFNADVSAVLEFLTGLFAEGLGYSAIKNVCSAISAVVRTKSNTTGSDPTAGRFVKGILNWKHLYQSISKCGALVHSKIISKNKRQILISH